MQADYCYNFRFESQEYAEVIMSYIKRLPFTRKKKYIYDSSVMFKGRTYTVKFYLKHQEYKVHDFQKFYRKNRKVAQLAGEKSKGIIRFEVSLRTQALAQYFGKRLVWLPDIAEKSDPKVLLKHYLRKTFSYVDQEVVSDLTAQNKLVQNYGARKAFRLLNFWKSYYSEDELEHQRAKRSYSRSQVWRNLKDIKQAGLGLPQDDTIAEKVNLSDLFKIE